MKRIYIDLEYMYSGMTRESGRPTESDQREILQIAAIKYDIVLGKEISHFDMLVLPVFSTEIPSFFTELTGITKEQIQERGVTFPQAIKDFCVFSKGYDIWTFDKDWDVIRQNCEFHNISFPFAMNPFARVKEKLVAWSIDAEKYTSGTLYKAAKIAPPTTGQTHNALFDVRSMASSVHIFEHK